MLTIRQARSSDCDAMWEARRDAIVRHCGPSHGEKVARKWAAAVDGNSCAEWLESRMVVVAEEHGLMLAYAGFDPTSSELELVATETAEQRAIPAALIAVVEAEARARELDRLRVLAVAGTEKFFTGCGFSVDSHQPSDSAHAGPPAIRMSKRLVYTEPRPERRRNGTSK